MTQILSYLLSATCHNPIYQTTSTCYISSFLDMLPVTLSSIIPFRFYTLHFSHSKHSKSCQCPSKDGHCGFPLPSELNQMFLSQLTIPFRVFFADSSSLMLHTALYTQLRLKSAQFPRIIFSLVFGLLYDFLSTWTTLLTSNLPQLECSFSRQLS